MCVTRFQSWGPGDGLWKYRRHGWLMPDTYMEEVVYAHRLEVEVHIGEKHIREQDAIDFNLHLQVNISPTPTAQ